MWTNSCTETETDDETVAAFAEKLNNFSSSNENVRDIQFRASITVPLEIVPAMIKWASTPSNVLWDSDTLRAVLTAKEIGDEEKTLAEFTKLGRFWRMMLVRTKSESKTSVPGFCLASFADGTNYWPELLSQMAETNRGVGRTDDHPAMIRRRIATKLANELGNRSPDQPLSRSEGGMRTQETIIANILTEHWLEWAVRDGSALECYDALQAALTARKAGDDATVIMEFDTLSKFWRTALLRAALLTFSDKDVDRFVSMIAQDAKN